ncbi:MAG: type II toxin-antitoxin system PemK/MazF family toxin [Terriglobia bacterium]
MYRVFKPGGDPKQYRTFPIVSRSALIDSRFSTVICAPVLSNGEGLSTQVAIGPDEGLKHSSWITCDNLVSIRKSDLTNYVDSLSRPKLAESQPRAQDGSGFKLAGWREAPSWRALAAQPRARQRRQYWPTQAELALPNVRSLFSDTVTISLSGRPFNARGFALRAGRA